MYFKNSLIILVLFILCCQPVEIISPAEIDNSIFNKLSINAKDKIININYKSIFSKENIEDQINNPPINIIQSWASENINNFGNQNKFVINILDASIKKKEIENTEAKKYEDKFIFLYEVFFLVEYELFDDDDYLLANTTVESSRSTTSNKYISLNESELIINDLLNNALKDFTSETESLLKIYMSEYL